MRNTLVLTVVLGFWGHALADCPTVEEEPISTCRAKAGCGGGKATTALGIILGGAGAGASGGRNQALDNYQACLDRDIAVQKMNADARIDAMSARNPPSAPLVIKDGWFFVVSKGGEMKKAMLVKSTVRTVGEGQKFGFVALFQSSAPAVKERIELRVPRLAEHFGCASCAPGTVSFSSDHKMVAIEMFIDATRGFATFHWGIDNSDPEGNYELEVFLDDSKIASYDFKVRH